MAIIKVEFETKIPDFNASDQEIIDWVRLELHANGQLSMDNPFSDIDLEANFSSVKIKRGEQ